MPTLAAHAKINLGLRVLRKRADGYHDIETVFLEISLADEITFAPTDSGIRLEMSDLAIPVDETNLCIKAARLLQKETRATKGAHISVLKRIPPGAGLGGGSSNAAAVLKGLNRLWGLGLGVERLRQLGAQLSADVPFFISGGCAYATGIGEKLTPLEIEIPHWIVTATPQVQVSTKWAYGALNLNNLPRRAPLDVEFRNAMSGKVPLSEILTNDFEEPVFKEYPEIAALNHKFLSLGASAALMSGSGSTVFGLFTDRAKAEEAVKAFAGNVVSLTPPRWLSGNASKSGAAS